MTASPGSSAKTPAGATAGLDYALYAGRVAALRTSVAARMEQFEAKMKELLG